MGKIIYPIATGAIGGGTAAIIADILEGHVGSSDNVGLFVFVVCFSCYLLGLSSMAANEVIRAEEH